MEGFLHYWCGGLIFGGAYTWRGLFSEFYGTQHHIPYIDNFLISSITSVAFSNLTASLERCSIFANFNPPSGLKKCEFQLVLR